MPSLIGVTVNGVSVADNYRKQIVPFSRFGTRKIVWFRVGHIDDNDGGALDMSALNIAIDAIQTKGELVTVGAPYVSNGYGKFVVGLFEDTFNNGILTNGIDDNSNSTGFNGMSETLEQAVQNALSNAGVSTPHGGVNVQQIYMFGAPWQDTDTNDGWSVDPTFAEPDLKRDFNNGYLG